MIKIKFGKNEDYDKKYPVKMTTFFFAVLATLAMIGIYAIILN